MSFSLVMSQGTNIDNEKCNQERWEKILKKGGYK